MVMVLTSAFASAQSTDAEYFKDFVTFIWVYSMDTDPEPVTFILRVNGMEWFRFSSPIKSEIGSWSVHGRETLTDHRSLADRAL